MPTVDHEQPWEQLGELVRQGSRADLDAFLSALPPGEIARAVSRLPHDEQEQLLTRLHPDDAADLVEQLPDPQAAGIVERLDPGDAARIVHEMPSDERADLIGGLPEAGAEAILAALPAAAAEEVRALAEYPDDVAGGLMVTEVLAYPEDATVGGVLRDLRAHAEQYTDDSLQYAYVTTRDGRLAGVLRLHDLLLRPEQRDIASLMTREPESVRDTAGLRHLRDFFERYDLLMAPVVDGRGRLVGAVHRAAVADARRERSVSNYLKALGIVGGEELRGMPVRVRSRRRLAWLSLNMLLNMLGASVIIAYQDTLRTAIALAVFLPIISDMSGCSGNQAVAVSIRELTLGLIRPQDALRVWLKEAAVGLINGAVLGTLIALAAWLWKGNATLGLVVGSALGMNTLVAVSIGGTVPLLMRRLGLDPALASGPVLTTVTDMCGFFLTLAFASAVLGRLA